MDARRSMLPEAKTTTLPKPPSTTVVVPVRNLIPY
jgi:hypothetical protein